jgi:hypothetical protein
MKRSLLVLVLAALGFPPTSVALQEGEGWKPLFNGKDLTGWETWLGKPHKSVDVPDISRGPGGDYSQPVGLNKDPKSVFTIVEIDGKLSIRISGEIFGAITTKDEFENFHLKLEFKWGQKKWPPREEKPRHSGLLYHCVGPHGAGGTHWMRSFECQIQEHDCGDFWSVDRVIIDVEAVNKDPKDPKSDLVFKKGAAKVAGTTRRILKDTDHEKPAGEWNTIELYCVGQTSAHVVNGKVVMVLQGLRQRIAGIEAPLTRGKLQLQSEGAEVFYRNLAIRPISEIPKNILE